MNFCKICFVDTDKEEHQPFCPYNQKQKISLEDLFPGIKQDDN